MSQEPKGYEAQPNGKPRALSALPCPVCGTTLELRLLELSDEEEDEPDLLMLLDCPTGDYRSTLTKQDVTKIIADEVIRRMR